MAESNSLALLVQPPQIDLGRAYMQAAQVQGMQTQNSLSQFQLQQGQERANTLKQFGQTGDLDTLKSQPDVYAQMVTARGQLDDQTRKTFDTNMMRNAQGAGRVAAFTDPNARQQAWNDELDKAIAEKRIDQGTYQRLKNTTPSDLVLHNIMKAGLTVEQQITLEQKEKDSAIGARAMETLTGAFRDGQAPAAPVAPAPAPGPSSSAAPTSNETKLVRSESGGKPGTVNQFGYAGTYQFGAPRLADLGVYTPGEGEDLKTWSKTGAGTGNKWTGTFNVPGFPQVKTVSQFLATPEAQKAAFTVHTAKTDLEITQAGLDRYIGQKINGVEITQDGLRNMIHLGGAAGTQRFLESGGKANAKDANGTSLLDYARLGTGGGSDSAATDLKSFGTTIAGVPAQKLVPLLMGVAGAPGIPKETRDVAMEMLKTGIAESKPSNDQKEYLQYVQQTLQQGKAPMSFIDYQVTLKQAGSSKVTIDQKNESALETERGKGLGQMLNKMAESGIDAGDQEQLVGRLGMFLERSGTGADVAFTNWVRSNTGIRLNEKADAAEAAAALINQLKPRMRVPGSGVTSDRDMQIFANAIPTLLSTPEGKRVVIETLGGMYSIQRARGEIAQQWQTGEIDAKTAMQKIREIPDPFKTFRDFQETRRGASGAPATPVPVFATPADMQQALRDGIIKPGQEFRTQDGRFGTAPKLEQVK